MAGMMGQWLRIKTDLGLVLSMHTGGKALVCHSNSRKPNELFEPLRTCTWMYMLHINTHGLTKMYINKNKLPNFILKWLFHFAFPSAMRKSLSLDILVNIFSFPMHLVLISDYPYSLQIPLIVFQKKNYYFLKMLFKLIFTFKMWKWHKQKWNSALRVSFGETLSLMYFFTETWIRG